MIQETKNRLTALFTLGIISFSVLVLSISYFYLHESILDTLKADIVEDGREEFVDHYRLNDFEEFTQINEDEVFQIFSNDGRLLSQTSNSVYFTLPINQRLFRQADQDDQVFEVVNFGDKRYLIHYFRLDKTYLGRIAEPITQLLNYEQRFLRLVLLSSPGIVLLSFILGRLLVILAMRPITEAFRFQENFSSNVTHELHSPLTSIKGNLEVSLRKERKPEEYREFIALGLKETNRVIALLQDLYLLASANFQSLSLLKERVPVHEMLADLLKELRPRIEAKSLKLIDAGGGEIELFCDPTLMIRALGNLLDNAIKYSVENGSIHLAAERKEAFVRLTLTNQSKATQGMKPKELLTPFFRGSNTEAFQASGKGLGLNIVNYIVLSHGGKLRLGIDDTGLFTAEILLPQSGKATQINSL
ncbi:MAG: histidine kinase dimerization/phospho-acceptor domain-containing protein [bacterium]|nr:histidine kinase dimerization/phospho-acceptor domain-containing protein [bacterium]